jgi:hypothetical protein
MKLPGNAVGPTDIQAYRECPRRFAFGMRRHTDDGEHPEAQSTATAYGSAVHEAIAYAESQDADDQAAVQRAFDRYARWLEPADLQRLRTDLQTYRQRDYLGVRTVAVERELRMPLFEHEGEMIYLRTRIDRLYQDRVDPGLFTHVDYKSSAWPRSQREIDEDRQLWITNLIVHDVFPECERLEQVYDQLNFGQLHARKTDAQRALIREWAIHQITAILHDSELAPTKNEWCPWCPIMESCPIVPQLTEFSLAQIAVLAPQHKQGRKTVVELDPELFDHYAEQLEDVGLARKVLERYDDAVRETLRRMPTTERERLGYQLAPRSRSGFSPDALRAAHELLGDDFYLIAGLTKTAVEQLGSAYTDTVLSLAEPHAIAPALKRSG